MTAEIVDTERPRGRIRWRMASILFMLTTVNYVDRGVLSVAVPDVIRDLHLSSASIGLVLSIFLWPYVGLHAYLGWLTDRFGAKPVMGIAIAAWSAFSTATSVALNIPSFLLLRAGLGCAESPLLPAAFKAALDWFPATERGAATSFYLAGSQVGLAIAPPLASVLIIAVGWRMMFVITGLIGFVALAVWLKFYTAPENHPSLSQAERDYIFSDRNAPVGRIARPSFRDALRLFCYSQIWAMFGGSCCLQYAFWFYITWLPGYLSQEQHLSLQSMGLLSSLPFLASTVGTLIGGRISDGLIRIGMGTMEARRFSLAGCAVLLAIALFITAFSVSTAQAVFFLTLGMFAYGLAQGPYWALAREIATAPDYAASIGSIQNLGVLGGICAPILTGLIVDHFGGFHGALLLAGGLALGAAAIYGFVLRRKITL